MTVQPFTVNGTELGAQECQYNLFLQYGINPSDITTGMAYLPYAYTDVENKTTKKDVTEKGMVNIHRSISFF